MTLLIGNNLSKKYRSKARELDAVSAVSFHLNENEILGIVGESGSGKSTLLRMIAGLEKPDSGTLSYRGSEYQSAKVGYAGRFLQIIFQDAYGSFDPRLRMRDSMAEVRGKRQAEMKSEKASKDKWKSPGGTGTNERPTEHLQELLDLLRETLLEENLLDKRPGELSGGQCQRMSIVRALYSGAEILLCDEMTSALDVTAQAQIIRIFRELREKRTFSAIVVSHDIALVCALCDRVMVMKDGKVLEEGKTSEVVRNPKNVYTEALIQSAREQSF